jgi:hypothetical protein
MRLLDHVEMRTNAARNLFAKYVKSRYRTRQIRVEASVAWIWNAPLPGWQERSPIAAPDGLCSWNRAKREKEKGKVEFSGTRLRHVIQEEERVHETLKEFVAFSSIPPNDYEHHGLKLVPFACRTVAEICWRSGPGKYKERTYAMPQAKAFVHFHSNASQS